MYPLEVYANLLIWLVFTFAFCDEHNRCVLTLFRARTLRQADPHVIGRPAYTPFTAGSTAGTKFPSVFDTLKLRHFR
jgi:hypothetical protein